MYTLKLVTFHVFLLTCKVSAQKYSAIHKCTTPGLVALTFDDGPSPNGGTESVLKVLREKDVKATFFITGNADKTILPLDKNEQLQNILRQTFQDGHQIGSHSWSHPNLTTLSTQQVREEISKLERTVRDILGINMTIFRAPHGQQNDNIRKLVKKEFGYETVQWSLDTNDWRYSPDIKKGFHEYEKKMRKSVKSNKSSFIALHHDILRISGELARMAIDFVQSKGYKLVTVGECIGVKDYVNVK